MGYPRTHLSAATAAVADRIVASTAMKVGAYNVANSGAMPTAGARHVTLTHASGGTTDTLGTVTVAGTDLLGRPVSEVLTPVADSTVTGSVAFRTVTGVTGAGWAVDGVEATADTIELGCDAACIAAVGQGDLHSVVVNTAANGTVTLADAAGTIAVIPANQAAGSWFPYDCSWSGFLSVTSAAAADITVMHSGSRPASYAS